jgi:hypothetical protein
MQLDRELLQVSHCELLLWEADSWGLGWFWKLEEGESVPLEADTKQRPVKTVIDWELVYVKRFVKCSKELHKCSINPIANPKPVYNHCHLAILINANQNNF